MIRQLLILAAACTAVGCASRHEAAFDQSGYRTSAQRTALDSTGRQRMAEGDPQAAQTDFDTALQINPFDPIALNNVAVAKSENGQYHEAVALLERANRLAPENAEIAANLSRMRDYTSNYALQGADVGGAESVLEGTRPPASAQSSGLPPPPPPLWSTLIRGDAGMQQQSASYYYDGCAPAPGTTTKGKDKRKSSSAGTECR